MREKIKNLFRGLTRIGLFLLLPLLLFVFQNCGSMEAGPNPLYYSAMGVGCVGVSCVQDLNSVSFKSTVSGVIIDHPVNTAAVDPNICDNTTCFDLGGFCETGGYPGSVFYYQWVLSGTNGVQAPNASLRTPVACDDTGRFHVQVKIPSTGYNWDVSNRLVLTMKVIDANGTEITNSAGLAQLSYLISTRSL